MPPADPSLHMIDGFDPERARALEAALGMTPSLVSGAALPPFFHQIYFWDAQSRHALGPDGHPKKGDFLPDLGLPRRMWAAGRLTFHRPLIAGTRAERFSRIEGITRKSGKSGPLAFVTVRHDIKQRGALALTEHQDIVYREMDARDALPPLSPPGASDSQPISFDTTLLFRYSALTFNGHRIHYDADYARDVEGYGGLVVHGPLLAQFLMLYAEHHLGQLSEFTYRATAPLLVHDAAELCRKDNDFWITGPGGKQCMIAKAR